MVAIISNLDALIGQPHPGVDQFIDALAESFSAMRQALMTVSMFCELPFHGCLTVA